MVLFSGENIFIFEFKIMELSGKGSALSQIKEMKYYEKYISGIPNGKLFLIGIEFSRKEKNITGFEWEILLKNKYSELSE